MRKEVILAFSAAVILVPIAFWIYNKKKRKLEIKKKILTDNELDYGDTAKNIALSMSQAKKLYKQLIISVHPDRFPESKQNLATDLSARITKSKRNYDELMKLKEEVQSFLESEK